MVLQENVRRRDVTFLVHTFWTPPYVARLADKKTRSKAAKMVTYRVNGRRELQRVNEETWNIILS